MWILDYDGGYVWKVKWNNVGVYSEVEKGFFCWIVLVRGGGTLNIWNAIPCIFGYFGGFWA